MKKRILSIPLALLLAMSLVAFGCPPQEPPPQEVEIEVPVSAALMLHGHLGDLGFLDLGGWAMERAGEELGIEYAIVEAGTDPGVWGPAIEDLAHEHDIVVALTFRNVGHFERIAPMHPDVKFILADATVDFEGYYPELGNVLGILHRQDEGSFLAGALAALVTTSDVMPDVDPYPVIGFVGGKDIVVINDFLVGFIQGAQYINPDITILIDYAGTFIDPGLGKELALAQFAAGADIIFQAAGPTGLGVLKAAAEVDRWAIGVDTDQAILFYEKLGEVEIAMRTITSMLKKMDVTIFTAIKHHIEGIQEFGVTETWGIAEGVIGLADNWIYREQVPEYIREKVAELEARILAGEIEVESAYAMPVEVLDAMREGVAP